MTEECKICYYEFLSSEFYELRCCRNHNRVCRHCIDLLIVPLCPFCRTRIEGLPDRSPQFRGATSLDSSDIWNASNFDSSFHFVNPMDDSYLDSRILRRQMKRLRKLQERERQADQNRRINTTFNETIREKKKKDLQQQIREEQEIFDMEQEEESSDNQL